MTADAFSALLDYADRELEALVQKNALLQYLQTNIGSLQAPKALLLIRESLITDCLISIRRLDDSDKRTKASFPNLLSRLLPGSLDEAFLAELKADHTRNDNLTSFDERLSSVIQAWKNFAQEALAIRLVTDKWIAHFELEEKQSVPVALYAPHAVDPLPKVILNIDKLLRSAVAVTDELMKLTGVQNVDIHASFPAAQSTAAQFWGLTFEGRGIQPAI